ncbi:transcriptional regulator LldR [Candidatus Sodalis sp. SoCistrobi]|uniref:transcriptional regulator LldR n=1 Tax=Candidatus Sodalis sp. SoCistrobi TaxID=1922216 RepID=UPI00093DF013
MTPPPRLADRIARQLERLIAQRPFAAGARLPAERQLASELGVSRSSLREAIQKLISQGLLVSRRGGGTFVLDNGQLWTQHRIVLPLQPLMAEDADYRYDVLEARQTIEAGTAWHAALRATEEDKARLQACFDATRRVRDQDDPEQAAQADVRFHLTIAEASHNLVLLQTMRGLFTLLQTSVQQSRQRMYTRPAHFARLTEQHQTLLDAILAGDAPAARQAAVAHLDSVHQTLRSLQEEDARLARLGRFPPSFTETY